MIPVLTSDSEYLEAINQETLHSDQIPDIYLLSSDSLEKAYLAGLASKVPDTVGICNTDHFPQAALSAVTYDQKLIGYPVYLIPVRWYIMKIIFEPGQPSRRRRNWREAVRMMNP